MVPLPAVPAVEQQPCLLILEQPKMQQRLLQRSLRDSVLSGQPGLPCQEQHGHVDRIGPHLFRELGRFRDGMLQRPFPGSRRSLQHPAGNFTGLLQEPAVLCPPVQPGKNSIRSHGINHLDAFGLLPVPLHPLQHIIDCLVLPRSQAVIQDRNYTNPRHPVPVANVHSPVAAVPLGGHIRK
ncbi:hypothetical protein D3C81_1219150 [compost metagenome]